MRYNLPLRNSMSWMRPSNAGGLNDVMRWPVLMLIRASERTVGPFTVENPPAIHTLWPSPVDSTSVTSPLSPVASDVSDPVEMLNAKRCVRATLVFGAATVVTVVKLPPTTMTSPTWANEDT